MARFRYHESWLYHRANRPTRPHVVHWYGPDVATDHRGQLVALGGWGRRCRSFSRRTEARRFKAALDRLLNSPLYPELTDPDWESMVIDYIDALAAAGRSHAHQREVCRTLGYFWRTTRPATASDISPASIDHFMTARRAGRIGRADRAPSDVTLAKDLRQLHAFFGFCCTRRWLSANPADEVLRPRPPRRKHPVPTDAEWMALLAACADPALEVDAQAWHLLILLAGVTGIDQADLLRLRPDHIDLGGAETGGVGLIRGLLRSKVRAEIYHGLPPAVCDRIAIRLSHLPPGASTIFPWTQFPRRQWSALCAAAHWPHDFRALRRTAGTRAAETAALAAGAAHLGHSDPSVFLAHYSDDARIARATAARARLPDLPPFPPYSPPRPWRTSRAPRAGSGPSGPAG